MRSCFLRLWVSRARSAHWLARKIDFLVRVSRRVPKVPQFRLMHRRSGERRWPMARCRYMPQHTLPSAHRDCESITLPAAHHARSSRNREGTSPPYARRRLRHPRGGRQHEPGTGCWNGQGRIRNGSRCPHTASDKCPGGRVTAQVNIAARIIEFNGFAPLGSFTYSLTLYSECFSTFPHGTCSLSVSW